jgi:ATP-dependent DNA helicase PIF1
MHVTNATPSNCCFPKVNGSLGVVESFDTKTGFPVVAFSDGDVCRVDPATWQTACKTLTRIQIPLIVAWAVTSHKIQGSTLDAAVMDIANCFELNQAYMIFSRVKSLDGVFLLSFDPNVIKPCPEALEFYRSLEAPEASETI